MKWVESRKGELLPIDYHHVVFTIPEQLNDLVLRNKPLLYKILFAASAATLQTIAADPRHLGAQIGFFSVLHSWGQNLLFHPHIHCVVTGGGISLDGTRWVSSKPGFFLPVRVLSRLFRRLFLEALAGAFRKNLLCFPGKIEALKEPAAFFELTSSLRRIEWVVYSKPPFGGAHRVLEYLGRYTHRVALDNRRILDVRDGKVTFQFKQYRSANAHKFRTMTLAVDEFIRRFLLHWLPPGLPRIRHYGLFAGRTKKSNLMRCRELLQIPAESFLPMAAQVHAVLSPYPRNFPPVSCMSYRPHGPDCTDRPATPELLMNHLIACRCFPQLRSAVARRVSISKKLPFLSPLPRCPASYVACCSRQLPGCRS